MTCIIAIEQNNQVLIGADRMGSSSYAGEPVAFAKCFKNGPLIIGYSGSFRAGQILQYGLEVPPLTNNLDKWVAIDLPIAIRKAFKDNEWLETTDGKAVGAPILIAVQGRCYQMQTDFSFLRSLSGEYAIGSGQDFAMGSLRSTRGKMPPKRRIIEALDTASEYVLSVAPPYDFVISKGKATK